MATIRKFDGKRGPTYNVQIRLKGRPAITMSFKKLTDAKRWAEKTEMEMRSGKFNQSPEARKKTLGDAIERYKKYILPKVKKSRRDHLIDWWDQKLGQTQLIHITPALVSEYRDRLMDIDGESKLAPATVVKYLNTLSHILSMCVKEWHWLDSNPVSKVTKPSLPKGRNRFLSDEERVNFLEECKKSSNQYLYTITILAISTGMRRGELLNLRWNAIDFERGRIVLQETKNGETRILPLVGLAFTLLKELESSRRIDSQLLFPGEDPEKPIDFRSAWRVAVKRAQLEDFKFHDLRHSFASYCVMNGSTLNEVADLLGHKSYQTVTKRYCHLSDAYQKEVVTSMNEKVFGGTSG